MNTLKVLVAVLAVAVVAVSIGLAVALADRGGGGAQTTNASDPNISDMIQAMHSGHWGDVYHDMQAYMGPEGYRQMMSWWQGCAGGHSMPMMGNYGCPSPFPATATPTP